MRAAAVRWVLVLLVLVVGACGGGGDDGGDDGPASEASGGDGAGIGEVELLSSGSEPREELRLGLEVGQTFRSTMVMRMGLTMTIDGEPMPATALPPMRFVMSGRVDELSGDGVATYSFTYDELRADPAEGVDPNVVSQVDASLQAMKGMRGTGTVDRQARSGKATLDTAGVTDPNLKSTLDSFTSQVSNLTVPFPSEAVGVGARWRGRQEVLLNGITTRSTSTYTLQRRDGDEYEFEVEQDVTSPKGEVDLPGLPEGASAELVDYAVTNRGTIRGRLSSLLPVSSRLSGGGDIEMGVTQGSERSTLLQKLTMDLALDETA